MYFCRSDIEPLKVGDFVTDPNDFIVFQVKEVLPKHPEGAERQRNYLLSFVCHINQDDGYLSTDWDTNRTMKKETIIRTRYQLRHFQEFMDVEIEKIEKIRESLFKASDLVYNKMNQK